MAPICKSILGRNLRDLEVTNRSSGDAWIQTDLVLPHIQMLVVPLDPPPAIDLHLCVVVDQGHFHGVPLTGFEVDRDGFEINVDAILLGVSVFCRF
jgi:hypothetical protein